MDEYARAEESGEEKTTDITASLIFSCKLAPDVRCITDCLLHALHSRRFARNSDGVDVWWDVVHKFRELPASFVLHVGMLNRMENGGAEVLMQRPFAITETIDLGHPAASTRYAETRGQDGLAFLNDDLNAAGQTAHYKLVGCVIHTNASGGHFVAARQRHPEFADGWCVYDDDNCTDHLTFARLQAEYFDDVCNKRVSLLLYALQGAPPCLGAAEVRRVALDEEDADDEAEFEAEDDEEDGDDDESADDDEEEDEDEEDYDDD